MLLDEPLAALDAGTRLEVRADLRRRLAEFDGATVVVTHDAVDAFVLADRLVVVEDGRVVQTGTPAEVASRPVTAYVARLVGLNLYRGEAADGVVTLAGGAPAASARTTTTVRSSSPSGRRQWPCTAGDPTAAPATPGPPGSCPSSSRATRCGSPWPGRWTPPPT